MTEETAIEKLAKLKERQSVYQRTYREKNKEKCRALQKEWREKNKDYLRIKKREYRERNKDRINEEAKIWRDNNPEKIKLYKERFNKKYNTWGARRERSRARRKKAEEIKRLLEIKQQGERND